jgi:hypothetical protein
MRAAVQKRPDFPLRVRQHSGLGLVHTREPGRSGAAGPEPVTQGIRGEPRRQRLLPRHHAVLLPDQCTQRVRFLARHRGMLSPGADIPYDSTCLITARRWAGSTGRTMAPGP